MIPPGFKLAGAGLEASGNDDFYDFIILFPTTTSAEFREISLDVTRAFCNTRV
jgi:hypothetical protein